MFTQLADVIVSGPKSTAHRHLLKAHLASFLDGVLQGHISMESAQRMRAALAHSLTRLGYLDANRNRTSVPLEATALWNAFGGCATTVGDEVCSSSARRHKIADTRLAGASYGTIATVSVAPLQFQRDLIRQGARQLGLASIQNIDHNDFQSMKERDVRLCLRALRKGLEDKAAVGSLFLKGNSERTVWIAPLLDRVQALTTKTDPDLIMQVNTNSLRDLLGLWKEDGNPPRPLGVFFLKQRAELFAPNVITAQGYERFRHRPASLLPKAPMAGLTYNLDRSTARAFPGAAEVVAVGIQLDEVVDVMACGCPSGFGLSETEIQRSHRAYAENVARKKPLAAILSALEAVVS